MKKKSSKRLLQDFLDWVEKSLKEIPSMIGQKPVPQPVPAVSPAFRRRKRK